MKKIRNIFICMLFALIIVTGCTKKDDSNISKSKSKGKCDVFECIKKIKTNNTLEEVNEIIGFDGEYIGKEAKVYYWQLTDDTGVQVQFFDSGNCRIDIDYKNQTIANKKNDFSKFDEIKKKLNKGESLKYDEFVKIIGGVEGTLDSKYEGTLSYYWVNKDGGYLTAQFDSETLECKVASGMF